MDEQTANTAAWQELDGLGVAGIVGKLMQRDMQESSTIMESLYDALQAEVAELKKEIDYLRPYAERYWQIYYALQVVHE